MRNFRKRQIIHSKKRTITCGVSWCSGSLARAKAISQWRGCSKTVTKLCATYRCECVLSEIKWPNNPSHTHSTPHTNLNYVNARRKMRQNCYSDSIHVQWVQMSPPNNDREVYLSTILSIKSLVHKMQSRMTICAAELANQYVVRNAHFPCSPAV